MPSSGGQESSAGDAHAPPPPPPFARPVGSGSGASAAPSSRLHRDELHCVFAFLGRRDLVSHSHSGVCEYAAVASVCRAWRDAAYSLPTRHAQVELRPGQDDDGLLQQIAASPLRRCIDRVDFDLSSRSSYRSSFSFRREFAAAFVQLRHLGTSIDLRAADGDQTVDHNAEVISIDGTAIPQPLDSGWPLYLPLRLQSLDIFLDLTDAAQLTAAVQSIAQLGSTLVTLELTVRGARALDHPAGSDRFAWVQPLSRLVQLRSFTLGGGLRREEEWTDEAIEVLRSLPSLTYLDCFPSMLNWRRLSAEPHSLQLQQLPGMWLRHSSALDEFDVFDLIRRLPTLTKLDSTTMLRLGEESSLLSHLPMLRDLRWVATPSSLPQTELRTCTQLQTLHLQFSQLSDDQLCDIMPPLMQLRSLSLESMPLLCSLRFLSAAVAPQLPATLLNLSLAKVQLPNDQLLSSSCPVRSLRSLHHLSLEWDVVPSDLPRVRSLVDARSAEFIGRECWPHMREVQVNA